jgi:hypothetical protein
MVEKYINEHGKECYSGVTEYTKFDKSMFHEVIMPSWSFASDHEKDFQWALHTNLGSITVLDRMTGFGFRDIETGFRAPDGKFWLASGNFDIRTFSPDTIGNAIDLIKQHANNCRGE